MATIVVGAGSAGAVIASRMSERADREVVLLEAGPDYPDIERLPDDLRDGRKNSMRRHDWGYRHQPTRLRTRHDFPRGKVVGGSSAVNTCIALRGRPYDYDEWADRGLRDWSFERCLPAFKRLETDLDFDDEGHGQFGAECVVRRVLFEARQVVAVEVGTGAEPERIPASRVVLAAGAINTPGILLRSGVGPERDLIRLGVSRVADVPGVGARLLDHPWSAIILAAKPGVSHVDHPLLQTLLRSSSEGGDFPDDLQV